jgi:hypothetical protein
MDVASLAETVSRAHYPKINVERGVAFTEEERCAGFLGCGCCPYA